VQRANHAAAAQRGLESSDALRAVDQLDVEATRALISESATQPLELRRIGCNGQVARRAERAVMPAALYLAQQPHRLVAEQRAERRAVRVGAHVPDRPRAQPRRFACQRIALQHHRRGAVQRA
jgi:hypothetical protein